MYKFVAEALVRIPDAEDWPEKISTQFGEYCQLIGTTGTESILDFGNARAVFRPTSDGLYFRIEAEDILTFYGARTLLRASLSSITGYSYEAVECCPPTEPATP